MELLNLIELCAVGSVEAPVSTTKAEASVAAALTWSLPSGFVAPSPMPTLPVGRMENIAVSVLEATTNGLVSASRPLTYSVAVGAFVPMPTRSVVVALYIVPPAPLITHELLPEPLPQSVVAVCKSPLTDFKQKVPAENPETVKAGVLMEDVAVSVDAVKSPPVKIPEPATDKARYGDVVPMPTLPPVVARYVEPVVVSCVVEALPFKTMRDVVADWPVEG